MSGFATPLELKQRRKRLGISQCDLSNLTGVKASWIAAAETARVPLVGLKADTIWMFIALLERQRARILVSAVSSGDGSTPYDGVYGRALMSDSDWYVALAAR